MPLVGRREELRALVALMEGGHDEPPIAIVAGEGGVGKSRLVEAVARRARERGLSVAHGRAFPVETGVPYALFSDAFLPLLRALEPETLTVLTRGGERELAYLFPALGTVEPASPLATDADEFRTRILWNFTEFLKHLSRREKLLVVLEDLQWADPSSLHLLHFLARQTGREGITFLCTYTDTERDRSPELVRTERSLLSLGLARVSRLEPLTHADTVELVSRTFEADEPVVREFCALLYGWTRGNPFFIEETLKGLVEAGKLHRPEGAWLGWEVREPALPRSVRDVVLERLARLSDDAARVAEQIAIVGTRARFHLLNALTDLSEERLLATLDELRDHGFLVEGTSEGHVVYDFVHPLVRKTLYGDLGLARARILHAGVAQAMERYYGPGAMEHAGELAYHFARTDAGHLAAKAVRYLAAAGRAALARRADREAVDYLETALERIRQTAFEPDEAWGEELEEAALLVELARAHHHLGEYDEAAWRCEAALATDLGASARSRMERYRGMALFWKGDTEGALEAMDRAEASAREAALSKEVARVRLARSFYFQETGRAEEAREEILRALETAAYLDDPSLLARAHRSLALVNIWTSSPTEVYTHAARALELSDEVGDRGVAYWAHWAMAVTRGLGGDTEEMARQLDRARELARDLRSPVLELWTAEMTIEHHYATGAWEAGIAVGEGAIALARSLNQRTLLPRLLVWTSSMYLGRGEIERGRALVDEARSLAGIDEGEDGRSVHAVVPAYIGTAHYHMAREDYEEAARAGESGLRVAEGTGYLIWALHRLLPIIAEAHLWLEDLEGARRAGERMRELSDRLDHSLGRSWADACEAMVLWKGGDAAQGAVAMREAAEALEAVPMIPAAARIRRQLAGRLADMGEREAALQELRRVHEIFVRLGATRELDKTRVQFRELGSRPPRRVPGTGASGLTERELEVARLVARGQSNKRVGKELGISPRTVSTHLSNIFQKLDVGSRMELAERVR
jgi:DNA-binding CsgD family transcriptional regulator/tetratricopeptide (TPR) repeat protein